MTQPSHKTEDVATLSAVAEAVVNLSIAERTHVMYGTDHPIGSQATRKTMRALERALELTSPVVLRFTPLAVFCGPHCLERDHPIYQRFARKLWDLGISEIRMARGLTSEELTDFLGALADGLRHRMSHREMEERLASATKGHLTVGTLREILDTRNREEVAPLSPEEEQRQWDRLMRHLGQTGLTGNAGTSPEPELDPASQAPVQDYATAVVDYLKQVQRTKRQEQILERSPTGRKLVDLLEQMNPELRHQILSQAVSAPDIDPAFLARLVDLTGRDDFVESLHRLNAGGQALPPSVFQTLALLSSVAPSDEQSVGDPTTTVDPGTLSRDLGMLFEPDHRDTYVHEAYDIALQRLEREFRGYQEGGTSTIRHSLDLSSISAERHFLFTMEALLEGSTMLEREGLRRRVIPEVDRSFLRFLHEGRPVSGLEALRYSKDLRSEEVEEESGWEEPRPPWEDPAILGPLLERIRNGDLGQNDSLRRLLVAIGEPVLDDLIELLRTSEGVGVRTIALETLAATEASPASRLLPLLVPEEPWYLHRNALHVLSERADPSGVEPAIALWSRGGTRSRVAILRYLLTIDDRAVEPLLSDALINGDPELILAAARMCLEGDPPRVREVARASEEVARTRRGSPLHLELLRLLARLGGDTGRSFVAETRDRHAPRMPWRRKRWLDRIDRILRGRT